jgi:hypothetical protein
MAIGLKGLLELDFKSRRRILNRFTLYIVIILSILYYRLVLFIVLGVTKNRS